MHQNAVWESSLWPQVESVWWHQVAAGTLCAIYSDPSSTLILHFGPGAIHYAHDDK